MTSGHSRRWLGKLRKTERSDNRMTEPAQQAPIGYRDLVTRARNEQRRLDPAARSSASARRGGGDAGRDPHRHRPLVLRRRRPSRDGCNRASARRSLARGRHGNVAMDPLRVRRSCVSSCTATGCSLAAINGPAAGVGLAFAMACDLVIASDRARLLMAFGRIELVSEVGLGWLRAGSAITRR